MADQEVIPVEPKPAPVIKFLRINIYQLVLNVGFRCACYLLDENMNVVEQKDLDIYGEDYNSWANDDEMKLLILSKLGLSPLVEQV